MMDYIQSNIDKILEYPDPDRCKFLISKDWYNKDHDKMNEILQKIVPKTHIVASPQEHFSTEKIILTGKLLTNSKMLVTMGNNHCHDNCEILLKLKKIKNIYTGYALSPDGLWRYHSWGIDKYDKIIETTEARLLYFGSVL
jgi:hypothetical protein